MSSLFLTPPYIKHFGLNEAPYTTNPDERYLYMTENHQEAMQMCARIIENREGAGLVVGEQGTGKTTIMRRLNSLLEKADDYQVAVIETAEHSPSLFQLVKEILESFGVECVGRDTQTRIDQLKQFLLKTYKEGQTPILFIDEAQQLSAKLLESLRGLLNFENPRGGKMIQIILFAMPRINRRLAFAKSLRGRLVKTILAKMNREDMEKMLRWRFQQAGGDNNKFPFDAVVLDELFSISQGNPRTICGIAQLGLEVTAARKQPITPTDIKQIAERRYV